MTTYTVTQADIDARTNAVQEAINGASDEGDMVLVLGNSPRPCFIHRKNLTLDLEDGSVQYIVALNDCDILHPDLSLPTASPLIHVAGRVDVSNGTLHGAFAFKTRQTAGRMRLFNVNCHGSRNIAQVESKVEIEGGSHTWGGQTPAWLELHGGSVEYVGTAPVYINGDQVNPNFRAAIPGDVDGDGDVDQADLMEVLSRWGEPGYDQAKLLEVLSNWGASAS